MATRRVISLVASALLVAGAATGLGGTSGFAAPAAPPPATGTTAVVAAVPLAAPTSAGRPHRRAPRVLGYEHLVVIYQENHSFDNLYGSWGRVGRNRVDGLARADAARTTQLTQAGTPYRCLPQNDVNLTSPPLPASCTDPQLS